MEEKPDMLEVLEDALNKIFREPQSGLEKALVKGIEVEYKDGTKQTYCSGQTGESPDA